MHEALCSEDCSGEKAGRECFDVDLRDDIDALREDAFHEESRLHTGKGRRKECFEMFISC